MANGWTQVKCPKCKKMTPVSATKCPYCTTDYTDEEMASRKRQHRQGLIGAILVMAVLIFSLTRCISGLDDDTGISPNGYEFIEIRGLNNYAMIVPAEANADEMVVAAKEKCGERDICLVLGWQNRADVARALPMTDNELSKLVFNFSINRNTGHEEALWNCDVFPNKRGKACLSTPD